MQTTAMPDSNLRYAEIAGFPRYLAGSDGGIWVLLRGGRRWARLKARRSSNGYLNVNLHGKGPSRCDSVHALILEAFVGPRPPGHHACHNNGDRTDNRPENLRWDTVAGNCADKKAHGTHVEGGSVGTSVLSDDQVMETRRRYAAGERSRSIQADFPIGRTEFWNIVWGKRWSHLPVLWKKPGELVDAHNPDLASPAEARLR
jgi:hypothetical protein